MYDLPKLPPRLFHVPQPHLDTDGYEVDDVTGYDWPTQRVRIRTHRHKPGAPGYWVMMKNLEVRDF